MKLKSQGKQPITIFYCCKQHIIVVFVLEIQMIIVFNCTMQTTQKYIADLIGVTQQMVSAIFLGKRRPHYTKAKMLEQIMDIPKEIWLEGTKEEIKVAVRIWKIRSNVH